MARELNVPPSSSDSSAAPWFALIDMNSYFATLEQQANPYLRGKPIGILKESGRSCVIAASKEAKAFGIKTGESLWEAKKKAPGFIAVPADFDRYFHNTKQLQSIFTSLSPDVDLFSLDEAFLDLTSCRTLYPDAASLFTVSQRRIQETLGNWVTFSLGVGRNRLQAKLGSEYSPKNGYFEITDDNLQGILMETKVEDICGIGFRLAHRLHVLGITHVYQLNFCDDEFLAEHFGPFWGPQMRLIGQGKETHFLDLRNHQPVHMKSVSRSKTLFVATKDPKYVQQMLYNLAEDMCFKARRMKLAGCDLGFSLRDTDGEHWGGKLHLKGRWVANTDDVFSLLESIFDDIYRSKRTAHPPQELPTKIIKVGVWLGGLRPMAELPTSWLPDTDKRARIFQAIDKVNEKHGLYTITSGKLLNFQIVRPEVTGYLGDKTYQMQFSG